MAVLERSPPLEQAMKLKTLICLSLITLVASLSPAAHAQTFRVIYGFENQQNDGSHPETGLTLRDGVLYGTTSFSPVNSNGAIFQLSYTYEGWTVTPLFQFPSDHNRSRGSDPEAVVFGPDGHIYDNAGGGGASGYAGAVVELTPPMSTCKTPPCAWQENVLYSFLESPGGMWPTGVLALDQQGNIYGTTNGGGARGDGTVYEMTKSGNSWTEKPIWNFSGGLDGGMPEGGVILDGNGNLFGTAEIGGVYGYGVVFELSYINGKWVETRLHDFQGSSDGGGPWAGLLLDGFGNLYGSTASEGRGNVETVFELSPSADTYSFNVLFSFPRTDMQRCGPARALTMDAAGNLYGTTQCDGDYGYGNVFRLASTQDGWVYSSLHDFTGGGDGGGPYSNVTIDSNGNLYGTTAWGGDDYFCNGGCGTVWMIKP